MRPYSQLVKSTDPKVVWRVKSLLGHLLALWPYVSGLFPALMENGVNNSAYLNIKNQCMSLKTMPDT